MVGSCSAEPKTKETYAKVTRCTRSEKETSFVVSVADDAVRQEH